MIGNLHSIVIDTADITGLARFYCELAGFSEASVDDDWIDLKTPQGQRVSFQLAPDHVAPRWPDPRHPQQFHLDFRVPDLEAASRRAIELGASPLPGNESWKVLADPSGHPFCLVSNDEVESITLADVGIDVPDGKAIAPFYAELLGLEVTYSGDEGAMVSAEGKLPVCFQNVAEYQAARWPDPAFPQQFHLDVEVEEIEAGERAVLALGAAKLPGGGGTVSGYRVYADPVGHPFCLVWGQ